MHAVGPQPHRQAGVRADQKDEAPRAGKGAQRRRLLENVGAPERPIDHRGAAGQLSHHAGGIRRASRIGEEVELRQPARWGLPSSAAAA